jgi:molybdopterin synthase sulfur carrier subunit
MIKVLFFARLKDDVGQAELELNDDKAGMSIAQLQQELINQGMQALADDSIRVARNQNFCSPESEIQAGDEIAFMPPVTGG